ncbi:diguanylate cyclase (GGDEF)-like protein [Metabacillus crassostreae]|uniref:putative bifunctional diguanylate cyclase/phosphodiesterase n=1 Tax=Metabacillus crassostreae TaxID=929098 RepID=UPI001958F056|nr:EAL domain-containing protein [Metabacillus crassostreae]MBM7605060.1 diguanylate cyclase (GGDEF)-like protein [Metabacillus crassostreae]
MTKLKDSPAFFLLAYISLFYVWILTMRSNESILIVGTTFFVLLGNIISLTWLINTYKRVKGNEKYFWLLLSLGVLTSFISNVIWYIEGINGVVHLPSWTNLLWVFTYLLYLAALIFKMILLKHTVDYRPYMFNLVIFMTVAIALSIHYLIEPIWIQSNYLIGVTILTIAYPIFDLGIIFSAVYLYYISRNTQLKRSYLYITLAFTLQILADSIYVYLLHLEIYQIGSIFDPFWTISILLLGIAGLQFENESSTHKIIEKEPLSNIDISIPYICVLFLLILVISSYKNDLNALSMGLTVSFLLILIRHFSFIRKNQQLVNEYRYLAFHDQLTSLYNRPKFQSDLQLVLEKATEDQTRTALLLIDLDRFKNINDTLGHYFGDCLLVEVANRLESTVAENGTTYRLGGDEFVIVLPDTSKPKCITVVRKLLADFQNPFFIEGYEITVSPSIGISMFPENGETSGGLLKHADAAMYLAKENGKNTFQFYDEALHRQLAYKMELENGLRKAIENMEFSLVYQPKVELKSGEIIGMEALLRWNHPKLGFVSPMEFIPVAEETGQIVNIGHWVLKEACRQNKLWQEQGLPNLSVSVNVSVRQFQDSSFLNKVSSILEETGLSPSCLELEITESIMQDITHSVDILTQIRSLGVKVSIDDFGTGYSSLNVLKDLPIDTLKIDKAFLENMSDSMNSTMIKSIIKLGLNLNLNVVAEGIETTEQMEKLIENQCTLGQGYLFSRPLPPEEFSMLLQRGSFSKKALT